MAGKITLNKVQLGDSVTPANNFVIKQADTPNGTIVIQNGNEGSATTVGTITSTGDFILSGNIVSQNSMGWRNRIINGDMRIDQRNSGASVTCGLYRTYTADRWYVYSEVASKLSVQQVGATPAPLFNQSIKATSLSAYSVATGDSFYICQIIEGNNFSDLGFGTAYAQPVTISFRVKSSLTGTFGGSLSNGAQDRSYPFSYTINLADTWETKSITIPGDTTGTWPSDNTGAARLYFGLGAGATPSGTAGAWIAGAKVTTTGAVSVVGTNAATFFVTGVQLEKGSVASSYEYLDYSEQLRRCQRYYYMMKPPLANGRFGVGCAFGTTGGNVIIPMKVSMRSAPTLPDVYGTATEFKLLNSSGSGVACSVVPTMVIATAETAEVSFSVASGIVAGNAIIAFSNTGNAYLGFSAEL